MFDIGIIGGGAAGLIAAIQAKAANEALSVAVFEKMNRVGKKLAATGNGRCNLTNLHAGKINYHGDPGFADHAMRQYPPCAVMAFFSANGVECAAEPDGRVYPLSGQASSVLDCLRLSMQEKGALEKTDCEITRVRPTDGGFDLFALDGTHFFVRRLIVCTGGLSAPPLGGSASGHRLLVALGHAVTACRPALVQLKTPVEPIRSLKGIRYEGRIALLVDGREIRSEQGEVLFTEYGLSGIAALQLSRAAGDALAEKKRVLARLQLLPMDRSEIAVLLKKRRASFPARPLEHFLTGLVNKRIGQTLLKASGRVSLQPPCSTLTDDELDRLASHLSAWDLPVTGTQSFEHAQVTAGGADTRFFSPTTMESRIVPRLYAAGEALNVDGDCGGYNLQWAWASGMLAANSAAQSLLEGDA